MGDQGIAAWKLPLIVTAIAVSIVGGFYLGGPGLGMAVGALAAAAIVVMAVRRPPLKPIVPAAAHDRREHLLVVIDAPLEDSAALARIAAASTPAGAEQSAEVRVITPVRNRFLDRWASDIGPGRERAQRSLVLSLASLARAGVDADARIGDEDMVQTVADQLREYPATEVFLVTGSAPGAQAVEDLRSRLRAPFHHLRVDAPHRRAQRERSVSPQTASTSRSHSSSTPSTQAH